MSASAVPRTTLPELCAEQLRRRILSGELRPGERLPPERRLAEQLGVTRVTLRSALSRLVAAGLLEARQGRGHTVQDFHTAGGPDLLPGLLALSVSSGALPELAAELLRVRRHLALALLERLLVVCPDPTPVIEAVADFTAHVAREAPVDQLAQADAAILAALLAASESPVLQLCLNPIRALLAQGGPLAEAMYAEPAGNVVGWQVLVQWLHSPTPEGVQAVAELLAARDAVTVERLR